MSKERKDDERMERVSKRGGDVARKESYCLEGQLSIAMRNGE